MAHRRRHQGLAALILILMGQSCLQGCGAPEPVRLFPNREATLGKTKEALLACAGQPIRDEVQDKSVILLYYKEASMLDKSFPTSRGSFPRPHDACWARVRLEGDRVTDIGYHSVPSPTGSSARCEVIFERCNPDP